jgi:hypothetical protein
VTELERTVLERIRDGLDPWGIYRGTPRVVSGAVGRLQRKKLVHYGYLCDMSVGYSMTEAGTEALKLSPQTRGGRKKI